ncbi:unnamed protein product [Malus baccata var. baccata]
MDASNMANQSDRHPTDRVGDQIELADQIDIQEAAKLEGNNITVLISSMDPDAFNAAKQGNLDVLKEHGENLDKILTATKNTVLHIYTACYRHPTYEEFGDEILESMNTVNGILKMCPDTLHVHLEHPEFSYSTNDAGETPLYLAVERGYDHYCLQILEGFKNPTYEGPNGRTALHAAVIRNDEAVAGVHLSHKTAGNLSAIFDIGGVFGGILAGLISDMLEARAVTSIAFLLLSVPALVLYRFYGSLSMVANIVLMFLSGLLVNGPYSLITTAAAADLGTQTTIKGNSRALATVTAIIDGTGSVGAALGPLLAGYISTTGWNNMFVMLILAIFCATLFLIRIARTEIKGKLNEGKWSLYSRIGGTQ